MSREDYKSETVTHFPLELAVLRAEENAELAPCRECATLVPLAEVFRCYWTNDKFCHSCGEVHEDLCIGCQERKVRIREKLLASLTAEVDAICDRLKALREKGQREDAALLALVKSATKTTESLTEEVRRVRESLGGQE